MNFSLFFSLQFHRHRFVASLSAMILCPILFFVQSQITLPEKTVDDQPKAMNAAFYKLVTVGFWPAAADWMWINTLQIIGERKYPKELKSVAANFYEIATDLDPQFYEMYEQAGVVFSFSFNSPDESIHFLEKGIQNISTAWTHPYTLHLLAAYLYSYVKKDWIRAKEHYLRASEIPGAPIYLQQMKVWLSEKDSEKMLEKRVLTILMNQATDELLKSQYQERLKSL